MYCSWAGRPALAAPTPSPMLPPPRATGVAAREATGHLTLRVLRTLVVTTVFHCIATMAVPALFIHTAVHWAGWLLSTAGGRAQALLGWAPTAFGLLLIPLLPLVDHPIGRLIDAAFERVWPRAEGEEEQGR